MSHKGFSYNRFAFHHQNEALLYQFFFHEYLKMALLLKKPLSLATLDQLMGTHPYQWQGRPGYLPKMLHYCELHKNHFIENLTIKTLNHTLERIYRLGQECVKSFTVGDREDHRSYQRLKREAKKVGTLLLDLLPYYRQNPHVLYFILSHHQQIDALFKKPMVLKFFTSLFPEDVNEVETFLTERFTKKGFHYLLPHIRKHLELLNDQ